MKKKGISIISFLLICLLVFPPMAGASSVQANDVKSSDWAAPSINNMLKNGYMSVDQQGRFFPYRQATRAEVADTIVKALQLPLNATISLQATDLPSSHPQYKAIRKLVELGVMDNRTSINPDSRVTRAQMAKMLSLAFHVVVDNKNEAKFSDCGKNHWAKNYIESLADAGIVQGKPHQKYDPNGYVTRAQLAAMISRSLHFTSQIANLEIAYDFLGKTYISTFKENEAWVNETITMVNAERKKKGLPLLVHDPYLDQLAVIKIQDMFEHEYFAHESPYYGHPWDMATIYEYEFSSFGENIARYLSSPRDVMNAWMASVPHKENILKSAYTHIGVAVKKDDNGKYYWVQLFSSK